MIRIGNEGDFGNWFRKNYKKLGFSSIFKDNKDRFPDFTMLENNKKIRVELEIKSSNFLLHKHSINDVDKVICIEKDIELKVPIIVVDNIKLIKFDSESPYSIKSQVNNLFKKNVIVTTSEVAKLLKISWNTAESYLKDLVIDNKLRRIKKEGVNIWLKKK
ncbi:MAG: hypothetical protein AABX83_01225 [Nanoarchaeota archaeon]